MGGLAGFAAAAIILFCAGFALNKQQMAAIIQAVGMRIAGRSALVALTDNIIADAFPEPVVEYKVLTPEFVGQMLLLHCIGVVNNSTFEMENIFEAIVQHPGTGFFTADATRAIHDNVLIFLFLKHTNGHG